MTTIECPRCLGDGRIEVCIPAHSYDLEEVWVWRTCPLCGGDGEIEDMEDQEVEDGG